VFGVSGVEFMVILLVALIVLGPEKLPDAVRKTGRVVGELRKMSSGFQAELRDAFDEPYRDVKGTVDSARQTLKDTANSVTSGFDTKSVSSSPAAKPAPSAPAPELGADSPDSGPSAASAPEAAAPEGEGEAAQLAPDDSTEPTPASPVPPGTPPPAS
jgi:sec-independent protein translocase protein TatB